MWTHRARHHWLVPFAAAIAALTMFATNAQAASTFLAPPFGTAGWATADFGGNDQISQLAIQPDGKILVAGTVDAASFTADVKILRYEPDGTPDPSFGNNGQITISYPGSYSQIDSLVAEADGSFLTSTSGFDPAQNSYAEVCRYSADGELDTSFGDAGP